MAVERCGSCSELTAWILPKVGGRHVREVDFRNAHWTSINGWFGFMVRFINKHAHVLFASAVRVHGSAFLARALDLNSFHSRLDRVFRIAALDDQVRMAVEMFIFDQ